MMWTAYEPSLNCNTRLTVPPGNLAIAAALALSAAAPLTDVPLPGCQPVGSRPYTAAGTGPLAAPGAGVVRGPGPEVVCAEGVPFALPDALLLELELPIARAPAATATVATPAAMRMVRFRENISGIPLIVNAASLGLASQRSHGPGWEVPGSGARNRSRFHC